ncbi:MAG: GxxExxY protein [Planctomycetaceae bacterium]|jgi:GxxExxY protein|nr:GxxExxY protein [Planctomycetaceae bacterium]
MENEKLTEQIIGCAYRVHNQLGFGFLESVYQKSMLIELKKQGLQATEERGMTVYYDEQEVGHFDADIVVENQVILELKTVRELAAAHEVQLVNYLTATKTDIGLLINFGPAGVVVKRKYRTYKKTK